MSNALTALPAASGVFCKCGTPIEDPTNLFPCDICGKQIDVLRLIKWREYGHTIRYWVCLDCWQKIYHAEGGDGKTAQVNRFLSVLT